MHIIASKRGTVSLIASIALLVGAYALWSPQAAADPAQAKINHYIGAQKCKSCHSAWREAYRAKHRTRPIPR